MASFLCALIGSMKMGHARMENRTEKEFVGYTLCISFSSKGIGLASAYMAIEVM